MIGYFLWEKPPAAGGLTEFDSCGNTGMTLRGAVCVGGTEWFAGRYLTICAPHHVCLLWVDSISIHAIAQIN